MKGKKYESPAPEPVILYGEEEIICLLDGENKSVNAKARGGGLEQSGGSQHHPIWTWPCWTHNGGERNDSWWMKLSEGGQNTQRDHGTIKDIEIYPGGWNI